MDLSINSAKISTVSDTHHWGGCFAENGFFLLLEATGSEDMPASVKGKEILEKLLTDFTNFRERNLHIIVKLLDGVRDDKQIDTLIIGLIIGQVLYLGSMGKGTVWMGRDEKIGMILEMGSTSSGELKTGDVLIFHSSAVEQILNNEKKQQIFAYSDLDDAVVKVNSYLSSNPEMIGKGIILASVSAKGKKEEFTQKFFDLKEDKQQKLISLWQNIKNRLTYKSEGYRENPYEARTKRTLLTIAVILIILLMVSIFLNISHSKNGQRQKLLSENLSLITHQYEEAVSLIDLNPSRSRDLLSSSKLSLLPLLKEFPKNTDEYKEVNMWLDKISSAEVTAYKIYKLTAAPLFFDLNLIKQGGMGVKIVGFGETKAILDTANKVLYSLSTKTKKAEILAGGDIISDAQAMDIYGKNVFIINNTGIIQIDINSKSSKTVIQKDEKWGEITSLSTYGGNIYLLDIKKHVIWKYIATDLGFSQRYTYLNPDVRVNFSEASKMVIDGSVWVIAGNEILKFTKGLAEQFAYKGFSDTLSSITSITTGDNQRYLYLLDKTLSRIVVFDKDGTYYSQYQWDELKNASDVLVSEEEKKIFVLSASKIYAIDIK